MGAEAEPNANQSEPKQNLDLALDLVFSKKTKGHDPTGSGFLQKNKSP